MGYCGVVGGVSSALVSSAFAHFGEEEELTGLRSGGRRRGSGTVFFAGCNLLCAFCQNYGLSRASEPFSVVSVQELAALCLELQENGCANVNFVTPTHFSACLAQAVLLARQQGLTVPVVWNCGGYEALPTLRALAGTADVYMPDVKSLDPGFCGRFLGAPDYPEVVLAALEEMARQVGPLQLDPAGLARRGLLVRHLVMPEMEADSRAVIEQVARICPGTAINVMAQYHPCGQAGRHPQLTRRPDPAAVRRLRAHARKLGLRELNSHEQGNGG